MHWKNAFSDIYSIKNALSREAKWIGNETRTGQAPLNRGRRLHIKRYDNRTMTDAVSRREERRTRASLCRDGCNLTSYPLLLQPTLFRPRPFGCRSGFACRPPDSASSISNAAVTELATLSAAANQATVRKPATNASRITCRPRASAIAADPAARRGRSASTCLRTSSGILRMPPSSVLLNTVFRTKPSAATASSPAARETALLIPDATPECSSSTERRPRPVVRER